jgi:hypothetical protein
MDKKLIMAIAILTPLVVIACKMLKGETKSNLEGRAWTVKDRSRGEKGDIIIKY